MLFTTGQFSEGEHRTISFKRLARKIFIDDWPMKLVAAVITLALYLYLLGEVGTGTLTVPLNIRISDNAEFLNPPDKQVDVFLKGDKAKIDDLIRKNDLSVFCDITDITTGDRVIDLRPDMVYNLPPGVTVSDIRPKQVLIKLEAVIEKDIPVKAAREGSVPEGSQVYGETVTPAKVRVRGPASIINTLEFVSTEKIDLENKTSDLTARQVAVSVSNPKARVLNAFVDVVFRIGEKRGEKVVTAAVKGDPAGKKVQITVTGALSILKDIKPGDIKVETAEDESGAKTWRLADLPAELDGKIEIAKPKN